MWWRLYQMKKMLNPTLLLSAGPLLFWKEHATKELRSSTDFPVITSADLLDSKPAQPHLSSYPELMVEVLGYLKAVTLHLQKNLDIEAALKHVKCVGRLLQEMRDMVFSNTFEAAKRACETADHEAPSKHLRRLSYNCSDSIGGGGNVEERSETELEFRRLYNSVINHCAQELESRFKERDSTVIVAACKHLLQHGNKENLNPLCEILKHNLDNCEKLVDLHLELQLAESLIKERLSLVQFADEFTQFRSAFPGINLLVEAALIILGSTTDESCFSHSMSVLHPLRWSMLQERKACTTFGSIKDKKTAVVVLDYLLVGY
ncbi:uncharacterized protein LOC128344344 [Hemicordylus capensis]|uniref:uncharacterized protein LOC128344344 n=1 Tax=Hemicordylus capensis TaxID=884348 RepID=UPI002302D6D0|nr:uncharacterized protein LOC128344344 [Hemicordylus capensis]XP_053150272.1 uncharacterized protein LOC128344344 [Hemicordylus capensis]XP_053150273.1 uncharacterized protein LOC128344344 [Hemicordylus capensis]XP_053150274.1 uncharacterized protein LOC128344344 [Hemicordylus capensis]XP_053150275.1 uncharacterized protein LOC128344344 [Hemicordylus capensis]